MANLNRVLLAVGLFCFVWVAAIVAANGPDEKKPEAKKTEEAAKFLPNEVQQLRLQIKQRDAQLAMAEMKAADAELTAKKQKFQQSLQELSNESELVKKDNKWPTTVAFDPNTLTFSEPEKKADAKKPAIPEKPEAKN